MQAILIKQYDEAPLVMNEDGAFLCEHEEAYIEPKCCNGFDSEGNPDCSCGGRDSVICPAVNCTGIEDYQVDALFDRLTPEPEEDYYE